jgi:hypothetical protein
MSGKAESTSYGGTIEGEKVDEGPSVLKLPEGRLYFGYPRCSISSEIDPKSNFAGDGQSLRKKK